MVKETKTLEMQCTGKVMIIHRNAWEYQKVWYLMSKMNLIGDVRKCLGGLVQCK